MRPSHRGRPPRGRVSRGARLLAGLSATVLLLASCAQAGQAGQPQRGPGPVTIVWPGGVGPDHWSSQGVQAWAAEVEKRSAGRITFEFHWAGALGPLPDHASMLEHGIADVGEIYLPFDSSFRVADWIAGLGWYHEPRPVVGDLQAYAATVEWGFTRHARDEFADRGLIPLLPNLQVIANHAMICREPVTSLADAQGLTVRVPGPVVGSEAEAVGMTPTQIPGPETYEALQRGIIDCTIAHPRDMTGYSLDEVAPHISLANDVGFSGFTGQGVYTSEEFWNSLDPEAQRILWDALPTYVEAHMKAALDEDIGALSSAATINEYGADFRSELRRYQQGVLDNAAEQAPERVPNPAAAVADFKRIYGHWRGTLGRLGYEQWPREWPSYIDAYPENGVDLQPWIDELDRRVIQPNQP